MMIIISKRPKCRHCQELMDKWNPWIPEDKQSHPGCAGKAMARKAIERIERG